MGQIRVLMASLVAVFLAGCASSSREVSTAEAARVRVVNDANLMSGCQVVGTVADNDLEDLQRKAARVGGTAVLLTPERVSKGGYFGLQNYMTADVYRCENAR